MSSVCITVCIYILLCISVYYGSVFLADYLINMFKDRVIFIRVFQSNILISNMAQIHQNSTLRKEPKTNCLLCVTSSQQQRMFR